jgi:epoxyqueuosine reductase QueG
MNKRFGNMIWLGAILLSIDLEPDPVASYKGCDSECTLCIDSCPQHALDGITIDQKLCREVSISYNHGGGWVLSCNICRKICPYHSGLSPNHSEEESAKP